MKQSWQSYQKIAPKHARTSGDGILFHSKTEKDRYEYLRLLEKAHEIQNLRRQVKYPLTLQHGGYKPVIVMAGGKPAHYTPDFVYIENGITVIEDVKGYRDENSKLRIRVFEAFYDLKVTIVSRPRGRGWVTE